MGLLLVLCSCWAYNFSGSTLSGASSIAIERIDNNTTEYGLEDIFITKLNEQFEADNTLKVVPVSQGDLILNATITNYTHEAYTYDASETVQEYACRISIKINITYAKSEKILWEAESLTDYAVYSPLEGETQNEGNEEAIDNLITEIMNRTVRDW